MLVAIFKFNITHGFLNGLVFYSNILSLYLDVSVDAPNDFQATGSRAIINFLNLNSIAPVCLYDGVTELHVEFFQFLFPLYLGALLVLITLILKYCHNKCLTKILSEVNLTHVFATLLFLCYARILRTSIDLILYVDVHINDITLRKWRADPNQDYFAGLHILGFFAGLASLIVFIPFPLLLLFPKLSLRLPYLKRLKPLVDAFTAPFADKWQFWVGFRLLCRVFLFLLVLLEETPRSIALSTFIIFITIFQAYIMPYKTTVRNLFDLQVMVNLTLFSLLSVVGQINSKLAVNVNYVLFTLLMITAIELGFLCVYYIITSIPGFHKLARLILTKLTKRWSKFKSALDKYELFKPLLKPQAGRTSDQVADTVTHTSLHIPSTVTLRERDGDFRETSYVPYRESIFET